jgi:hypothetical protein
MQRTAHADPESTIQAFIAAVNAGGGQAADVFTEDGSFIEISNEPFGIFGRAAIGVAFSELGSENVHVTLVSSNTNGTAITGVVEFSDNSTAEAGVTRIIEEFEAEVVNDQIVSIMLTFDESDAETAQYIAFLDSQPEDDGDAPPDAMQLALDGTQPGGLFTGTFEGVRFFGIEIAPGPAGALQPVMIHEGTCDAPGAEVQTLAPVLDGASASLTTLTLDDLEGRILMVHASESDLTVVACGAFADLEAIPMSPPVEALPDTGDGPSNSNVIATLMLVIAGALALGGVTLFSIGFRRRA